VSKPAGGGNEFSTAMHKNKLNSQPGGNQAAACAYSLISNQRFSIKQYFAHPFRVKLIYPGLNQAFSLF
jgi:hypothetical protein